jgi:hypothetical protein
MASPLSDILGLVSRLQESARRGDWKSAGELLAILPRQTLPGNQEELGEYLRCLKQALIVAKVSRAHSAASLARCNTAAARCSTAAVRLNAAAQFNRTRLDFVPPRQEFGEPAEF